MTADTGDIAGRHKVRVADAYLSGAMPMDRGRHYMMLARAFDRRKFGGERRIFYQRVEDNAFYLVDLRS